MIVEVPAECPAPAPPVPPPSDWMTPPGPFAGHPREDAPLEAHAGAVVENYAACRAIRRRLIGLQGWVTRLVNGDSQTPNQPEH